MSYSLVYNAIIINLCLFQQVCLIVPSHQSMNGGHCLIVPMQHVTQATVVDEDVWDEIKVCSKN